MWCLLLSPTTLRLLVPAPTVASVAYLCPSQVLDQPSLWESSLGGCTPNHLGTSTHPYTWGLLCIPTPGGFAHPYSLPFPEVQLCLCSSLVEPQGPGDPAVKEWAGKSIRDHLSGRGLLGRKELCLYQVCVPRTQHRDGVKIL